jgi:opacity protein-like surface antigen
MSTLTRIAGISLCVALCFLWSAPARAASAPGDTLTKAPASAPTSGTGLQSLIRSAEQRVDSMKTQADSLKTSADSMKALADSAAADSAAAAAKQPVDRFVPISTSRVESNDVSIAIASRLNVTIDAGKGWTFTNDIGMERRRYRQRTMEDITENVLSKANKIQPGLYRFGMQAGENYSKKTTLGLGRFGQDIIFDNTSGNVEFAFLKPLLGASASNLTITAEGSKGKNDFKYDRAYSGSASGTLKYLIGDVLTVTGGAGASGKREKSFIGAHRFGPMPSNADSMRAGLSYGRGETKTVEISYSWLKGVDRKVTPPRGNRYEILADPSLAKKEEARNRAEQLIVNTSLQPFPFLALDTKFKHAKAIQNYIVQTELSMASEENSIDANARYAYAARGNLEIGVSTSENLSDYGPISLSSYRDRSHVMSVGISQKLGDSLSITLNGSGSLQQRYFLKQDVNPRDADYLLYRATFNMRSPHRKFSVDVNGSIDRDETININKTLSGDNRIENKYQLGPRLSLKPASWLSITQDYIVKIEFTDFVYQADKNYLNRTTSLNTRAYFNVFRSLAFDFLHTYLKKDTGSYLMRAAGRRYSPSNESFEHSLDMTARYEVIKDLLLKAESDFRIQRSDVIGARNGRKIITGTTVYESGGMKVGFTRTKKFGERGGISLDVAYVRNYGPYITPERKEYWEADSELTLKF